MIPCSHELKPGTPKLCPLLTSKQLGLMYLIDLLILMVPSSPDLDPSMIRLGHRLDPCQAPMPSSAVQSHHQRNGQQQVSPMDDVIRPPR